MNDCQECWMGACALQTNIGGRGAGKIMLVGMNPGTQESLAGKCFVAPSGKELDAILAAAGISETDVRRTNAVRCEGQPDPAAIDACRHHLRDEILTHEPNVIVALGDVALQSLCKKSGVMTKRGKSFPLHASFGYECEVYVTFHPAYVLRSPHTRDTVIADLRRVRDRQRAPSDVRWEWRSTPMYSHALAWDIETIDAEKQYTAHPTQIAVAGAKGVAVGREADCAEYARRLAEFAEAGAVLVTHNGWRFDVPRLRASSGVAVPWGEDTMVLAYLCDETQPMGLESLVTRYGISSGWKGREYAALGSEEFGLYNARDAAYTRALWATLRQELGHRARIASEIILPALEALNGAQERGVWIDANAVAAARARYERELAAALTELAPGLNPNSPKQVLAAFRARGHRIRTTDKGALSAIGDDLARAILGVRGATKKLSTYVAPYEEASRADGRVHAQYHLYKRDMGAGGTDVFRTSASNPNVQNLDRNLAFFAAPPGRALVKADYGTMHIRLAAWLACERAWLDRYAADPRWDCHDWFREASGLPIDRRVAKSANFSQLYRGTGYTLVEYMAKQGVTLAPADADRVHLAWHRALPAIAPWYESVRQELLTHGYVENPVGMRRHFGRPQDVRAFSAKTFEECFKQAVNFKVLSFEAAIGMLALGAAHRAGLEVVLFVHDSIAVECDANAVDDTRVALERAMIEEPLRLLRERFGVTLDVPLVVDCEVQRTELLSV